MRQFIDYTILIFKGMGMGVADIIPGVSGGTIAFITGIYEELIHSIKSVNIDALRMFFSFRINDLWKHINGRFLLSVFTGILLSVIFFSKLIQYLLLDNPVLVWSFFFGLIIASSLIILRNIKVWNYKLMLFLFSAIIIAFFITSVSPAETTRASWFIFLCGAIAICAMILPGISGSFILLLLGKYEFILDAVVDFKPDVLLIFMGGAIVGLISFSNLLSWLLKRFHDITVVFLAGFMIGSLNKIWPWKEVVDTYIDSHGNVSPLEVKNVLPVVNDSERSFIFSMLYILIGVSVILLIELFRKKSVR